ncbi:MAG: serine/threonine protein kinase [Planctomycetes bacterium]|nr:serine/threonine protein kinase [Planctomycetota bacterium]MCB9892605.1 serine/threonine protein kinase [Planctomycetota bacterium]MCB9917876.1 serine/threonine protein kinase [Planctomycetota bacterium]
MTSSHRVCDACGAELGSLDRSVPCPVCTWKQLVDSPTMEPEPALQSGTAQAAVPENSASDALLPAVGERLGDYLIGEQIGKGGMAAVYVATHVRLGRKVAIKVLLPSLREQPVFEARLEHEARTLAQLEHPGIAGIHDYGFANGVHWIALEYVDGSNLRQLLQARKPTHEEVLDGFLQICGALAYAHDRGIVHRDLKPENILIDRDGRVRIADFGLAKLQTAVAGLELTQTRQTVGTWAYMAPEMFDPGAIVDHRADLFAVGVMLYEVLTGALPRGVFSMPSALSAVDVRFDALVRQSLAARPDERFQTAQELRGELERVRMLPMFKPSRAGVLKVRRVEKHTQDGMALAWGAVTLLLASNFFPWAYTGAIERWVQDSAWLRIPLWLYPLTAVAIASWRSFAPGRGGRVPFIFVGFGLVTLVAQLVMCFTKRGSAFGIGLVGTTVAFMFLLHATFPRRERRRMRNPISGLRRRSRRRSTVSPTPATESSSASPS